MNDETAFGSAGTVDPGGYSGGGTGESAPLQSRAHFLQNWNWASVASINQRLCLRGNAQFGLNRETHSAVAQEWDAFLSLEHSLLETIEWLQSCHRRAPFLFFNGNTFAEIGRTLANALFSDLPASRKKELSSAIAHFITGVLAKETMISAVTTLCQSASLAVGTRVKTLRGSTHGVIVRILDDGRVVWRPDGVESELTGLPESLLPDFPLL